MSYHAFHDEEGQPYGSFEAFHVDAPEGETFPEPGWYWWACFPGCLPDSDVMGPFDSEEAAIEDARAL